MHLLRAISLLLASDSILSAQALPLPCNGWWNLFLKNCSNPFDYPVPAVRPWEDPHKALQNNLPDPLEWLSVPSEPQPAEILIIVDRLSSHTTSSLSDLTRHELLALCTYHQYLRLPQNTTSILAEQRKLNSTIDGEVKLCYDTIFSKSDCGPLIQNGHRQALNRDSKAMRKEAEEAYDHWIALVDEGRLIYKTHGLYVVKDHTEQVSTGGRKFLERRLLMDGAQAVGDGPAQHFSSGKKAENLLHFSKPRCVLTNSTRNGTGVSTIHYSSPGNKIERKYVISNVTSIYTNSTRNRTHWLQEWKHNRTAERNKMRISLSYASHHPDLRQHLEMSAHVASTSTRSLKAPLGSSIDQVQEEHKLYTQTQPRSPSCIEGVICDLPATTPMCIPFEGVVCDKKKATPNAEFQPRSLPKIAGVISGKVQDSRNPNSEVSPFHHLNTRMHKVKSSSIHHNNDEHILPERQLTNLENVGTDENGYPCGGFIQCSKSASTTSSTPKATQSSQTTTRASSTTTAFTIPTLSSTTVVQPKNSSTPASIKPIPPPLYHAHKSKDCEEGKPCKTNILKGTERLWSHAECGFKPHRTGAKAEPDFDYKGEDGLWKSLWCSIFARPW